MKDKKKVAEGIERRFKRILGVMRENDMRVFVNNDVILIYDANAPINDNGTKHPENVICEITTDLMFDGGDFI